MAQHPSGNSIKEDCDSTDSSHLARPQESHSACSSTWNLTGSAALALQPLHDCRIRDQRGQCSPITERRRRTACCEAPAMFNTSFAAKPCPTQCRHATAGQAPLAAHSSQVIRPGRCFGACAAQLSPTACSCRAGIPGGTSSSRALLDSIWALYRSSTCRRCELGRQAINYGHALAAVCSSCAREVRPGYTRKSSPASLRFTAGHTMPHLETLGLHLTAMGKCGVPQRAATPTRSSVTSSRQSQKQPPPPSTPQGLHLHSRTGGLGVDGGWRSPDAAEKHHFY